MKKVIKPLAALLGILAGAGVIGLPLALYAGLPLGAAPVLGLVLIAVADVG